jgi:hypothetical protein
MGFFTPPIPGWPFPSPAAERRVREWEADYARRSAAYAACRLVQHLGSPQVHPAVQPIVELHDRLGCAASEGIRLA